MRNQKNKKHLKIVITSGDVDGIGLEVASKALLKLGPIKDVCFYLRRSKKNAGTAFVKKLMNRLNRRFDSDELVDVVDSTTPHEWVEQSARACLLGQFDALVTGPLAKHPQLMGHTEILSHVCQKKLFMSFLGKYFNVLLLTGHLPLEQALKKVDATLIVNALNELLPLRASLTKKCREKPIGLVAVNPHAGENGLIGNFEELTLKPLLKKLKNERFPIEGPLVPDVAFTENIRERFSFLACPYHDQGLIPFKLVHGFDSGVQVSVGAPFIRTSVDHGTASDIYGKNIARYGSMYDAIKIALQLAKQKTRI